MAIIKAYTDIEQSRKLAEILPFESADNTYERVAIAGCNLGIPEERQYVHRDIPFTFFSGIGVPSWSLAALLDILPNEIIADNRLEYHYQIHIRKYDGDDNTTLYQIAYGNDRGLSGSWHDMINTGEKENLIDCCVQMILKLHELKML